MSDKYKLENKLVSLYLLGNWSFKGRVDFVSEKTIVLNINSELMVIQREKLVSALIHDETKKEDSIEQIVSPQYQAVAPETEFEDIQSTYSYNSFIPEDMLEGEPEKYVADFAVSFAPISITTDKKEETNGSSKKTRSSRKKDNKQLP